MRYLDENGLVHLVESLSETIKSNTADVINSDNGTKFATVKSVIDYIEEGEEVVAASLNDLNTRVLDAKQNIETLDDEKLDKDQIDTITINEINNLF